MTTMKPIPQPAMTSEPEIREAAEHARQVGDEQREKDAMRAAAFAVHAGWVGEGTPD